MTIDSSQDHWHLEGCLTRFVTRWRHSWLLRQHFTFMKWFSCFRNLSYSDIMWLRKLLTWYKFLGKLAASRVSSQDQLPSAVRYYHAWNKTSITFADIDHITDISKHISNNDNFFLELSKQRVVSKVALTMMLSCVQIFFLFLRGVCTEPAVHNQKRVAS